MHFPSLTVRIFSDKDVAILVECLAGHASKWRAIGLQLGFLPGELDNITDNPTSTAQRPMAYLTEMLTQWVQWTPETNHQCHATEQAILSALRAESVGLGAVANRLKDRIGEKSL